MDFKFDFKSQVCTTKEQSERLLALGLNAETADMYYTVNPRLLFIRDKGIPLEEDDFPAWSLHRLIEILDVWHFELNFSEFNNAYDQTISYFEERVKEGFINKKYLEE